MIAIIAAVGNSLEIGSGLDMPWGMSLPRDLAHFRDITTNGTIIMGLKTFQSLGSRPLPRRQNIVLSHEPITQEGITWAPSLAAAYASATTDNIYIAGGGSVYHQTIDTVDELYITHVHADFPSATVYFPPIDPHVWDIIAREYHPADDKNQYPIEFIHYRRRRSD